MALVEDAISTTNCSRGAFWKGRVKSNALTEMIDDIDEDEIVSIIFLMTNRNTDIPKSLKLLLETEDKLDKLFSIREINNWEEKLLELLLLIKNIKIITRLGFKKEEIDEMKMQFKWDVHNCTRYLNSAVKSLYFLCDHLSASKTEELIEEVNKHVQMEPNGAKRLEVHILHWVQSKHISIDEGNDCILYFIKLIQFVISS